MDRYIICVLGGLSIQISTVPSGGGMEVKAAWEGAYRERESAAYRTSISRERATYCRWMR